MSIPMQSLSREKNSQKPSATIAPPLVHQLHTPSANNDILWVHQLHTYRILTEGRFRPFM